MSRYRELVQSVVSFFEQSQLAFSTFQRSTGLFCLQGCGACCLNHEVSASVIEMLPAAFDIVDRGKTDEVLNLLENFKDGHCFFYCKDSSDGQLGHCGNYQYRAMVCRSFGVAAVKNKKGEKTLSVCKKIKMYYPNLFERASCENAPVIGDFSRQVLALDQNLSLVMPINQALKHAIMLADQDNYFQAIAQSS